MKLKNGIGQDSHRFESSLTGKKLILAGVVIENETALDGNSDADVILHALCNAVSGVSGVNILGEVSDKMCRDGITDSKYYLIEALKHLNNYSLTHISISVECRKPHLAKHIPAMRASIAGLTGLSLSDVGITATSGEGLTAFGKGEGIQAFAIVTAVC